jgi:CTP:molybdopterin cytidylyltransferase MocA
MNVVLLAAGRGNRLSELTKDTHKSLLPISGRPVLGHLLDELIQANARDVVVVTGYRREDIEALIANTRAAAVRTVFNERYAADTNILSTHLGVEALAAPEQGYFVLETDVVMAPSGWRRLFRSCETPQSKWATLGSYGKALTGGALKADDAGSVEQIVYAPHYDARFEGWPKLLGALYVGAREVAADRALRNEAIRRSIAQYYMAPWVEHLRSLPCRQLDLSDCYGASFNDIETYRRVDREYQKGVETHGTGRLG